MNKTNAILAAALFVSAFLQAAEKPAPAARKPNVIYILADDLGYGDLSCYGQKKFQTPNIDRLASEGMKFTDHYSGSTVCSPSHSGLSLGAARRAATTIGSSI